MNSALEVSETQKKAEWRQRREGTTQPTRSCLSCPELVRAFGSQTNQAWSIIPERNIVKRRNLDFSVLTEDVLIIGKEWPCTLDTV